MPNRDGYSLIRQGRALEALQGGHIPVAAIIADLDEDWQKSLPAESEAHMHKKRSTERVVDMVAHLALARFPLKFNQ